VQVAANQAFAWRPPECRWQPGLYFTHQTRHCWQACLSAGEHQPLLTLRTCFCSTWFMPPPLPSALLALLCLPWPMKALCVHMCVCPPCLDEDPKRACECVLCSCLSLLAKALSVRAWAVCSPTVGLLKARLNLCLDP